MPENHYSKPAEPLGWQGGYDWEGDGALMSNEKPVELTEAERAALMHHIGGWKFERQGLANAEDAFMAEVSRIVAAREAAARREALLEASTEVARTAMREALQDVADHVDACSRAHDPGTLIRDWMDHHYPEDGA